MKSNERKVVPEAEKIQDEIEEKIDRLHKQNIAENTALRKLLKGLENIEQSKNSNSKGKTETRQRKQ